nr:MAG TPA: hypothetical protein [Caudoviricetes sp.]
MIRLSRSSSQAARDTKKYGSIILTLSAMAS